MKKSICLILTVAALLLGVGQLMANIHENDKLTIKIRDIEIVPKKSFLIKLELENKSNESIFVWKDTVVHGWSNWRFVVLNESGARLHIRKKDDIEVIGPRDRTIKLHSGERKEIIFNLLDGDWIWPLYNIGIDKTLSIQAELDSSFTDDARGMNLFEGPRLWTGHAESNQYQLFEHLSEIIK